MVARWVVPVVSHIRLLFVAARLDHVFLEWCEARHAMYVLMGFLERIVVHFANRTHEGVLFEDGDQRFEDM